MFAPDIRILVIDDVSSIRELVRNALKGMGYKNIKEVEDGRAGLTALAESLKSPELQIHLVISDWNMPNMTGLELLKQVRANQKLVNLPFVLLTSESDREQVTEAVLAGVSQYIVKPFSAKTFGEKLKSAYEKHNKRA